MQINTNYLDETEQIILSLRSLFCEQGYTRYRMSKFEEYDLYSRNKDFLVSEGVITFTDTNGKLMALKPDVTLSIIKNNKDDPDELLRLCYNENVYRISEGSGRFREIPQTGLECIGAVNDSCVGEVLSLAAESLNLLSPEYVLEISHLGIIAAFLRQTGCSPEVQGKLLEALSAKNAQGIARICSEANVASEATDSLLQLVILYGSPEIVLEKLSRISGAPDIHLEIEELKNALLPIKRSFADHLVLDFSLVGDMNYYNGITFKGFIEGVPDSVISGGRYDRLMQKMGRRSGAVGFAVYLDRLRGIDRKRG